MLDPFGKDSAQYKSLREQGYYDQRKGIEQQHASHPPVYIDDSRAPGTMVTVPEPMYYFIRDWMKQGSRQTMPLTKALAQKFDTALVNEFNLKFQSGDSTYFLSNSKRTKNNGTRTTGAGGVGGGGGGGGCVCKYLSFTGGTEQYGAISTSPAVPTALQPYHRENFGIGGIGPLGGGWHKSERLAHGAGRADFSHLHTYGQKNKYREVVSNEIDSRASMRLLYACVDDQELPSTCGCTKSVEIQGEFRGDLYAAADGLGAPRESWSAAEAWAVLSEYTVGPGVEALSFPVADRDMASAESSAEFSEEYLNTVEDVVETFVGAEALTNPQVVQEAVDVLTTLLQGVSPIEESGNGNDEETVDLLFDFTADISPGEEKVWFLGSVSALRTKCKSSYFGAALSHSVAAFSSTYNMHLTVPYDNSDPDCCIERYGSWAYGGYNMEFENIGLLYSEQTVKFNEVI
jgi:hypothetical protein